MKSETLRALIQVRVTTEKRLQVQRVADANDTTVADLLREALDDILETYDAPPRIPAKSRL